MKNEFFKTSLKAFALALVCGLSFAAKAYTYNIDEDEVIAEALQSLVGTCVSYDAATQTYTLLEDLDLGSDEGLKLGAIKVLDLNGHNFSVGELLASNGQWDGILTIVNNSPVQSKCTCGLRPPSGCGIYVCGNVEFDFGTDGRLGKGASLRIGVGVACNNSSGRVGVPVSWANMYKPTDEVDVHFEGDNKVSWTIWRDIVGDYSDRGEEWHTANHMYWLADGCSIVELPETDKNGKPYYYITEAAKAISESELSFAVDVATGARTVESAADILPFAHSVNAWGAASAAPQATITYTFNGGEPQTLGSYADGDVATWSSAQNGTYVFTHQPGGLTATFNVQIPVVTLLSAQQRYPWNGWLDYTYSLEGLASDKTYELVAKMTVGGVTKAATNELTSAETTDGNHAGKVNLNDYFSADAVDRSSKLKLQLLEVK